MGKRRGHTPIRTCIACRSKKGKGEMIRLAADPYGRVGRDDAGGRPGRGAYVCRDEACIVKAARGGRLDRAFRRKIVGIDYLVCKDGGAAG